MERLTIHDVIIDEKTTRRTIIDASEVRKHAMEFYWRLKSVEDILGDDYDLDRLRELVQADRDGRCVIYPKEGVLNKGDRVWYVDIESGVLESGTVFIVKYKDGKLDSFSVNFDSGDFDEFLGIAWGDCILGSKKSAEEALRGEKHG